MSFWKLIKLFSSNYYVYCFEMLLIVDCIIIIIDWGLLFIFDLFIFIH